MTHEFGASGGDFVSGSGGLLVPRRSLILAEKHHRIGMGGFFKVVHVREGQVIDEEEIHNIVVNQGLDHILGVEFTGVSQISTWYLAPFEGNYTPVATDTAASIVANATENTTYTASTRQTWVGAEASQIATNSASVATFTFNATKTIYGAFLISSGSKSSVSGILFAAAQFASPKPVVNTDQLLLTYSFTASSV
jgi:hypothetical protein